MSVREVTMNLGYWLFVWVLWNAETVLRATGDEGLAYPEDTDVNRFSDNLVVISVLRNETNSSKITPQDFHCVLCWIVSVISE